MLLLLTGMVSMAAGEKQSPGAEEGRKKDFLLAGRIKESFGKTDLPNAIIILYDSLGNPSDTIRDNRLFHYQNGERREISSFSIRVDRCDSTYIFDVACDGYDTRTITYRLEKPGKRETYRVLPPIYLDRSPRKLKEVTVTASKIKFYNRGDTVVFNADAFQLAEGSMLDALIAQLPGVELNEEGQIKVNGEFVESLLLNGKEFFDGNNQLMLENIGAYTVKNVEVYKGQTRDEKWNGDPTAQKHLTMDVRLKKEYNMGWLVNVQGGYGTEDRYSGRLFASWFNPTTNVTVVGNINNLNDTRQPGKNDTWKPEMMPSGTRRYRMAGMNYNYESPEADRRAQGSIEAAYTASDNLRTTARTNFLSGGNTFDNAFDQARDRETRVRTLHTGGLYKERYRLGYFIKGNYVNRENSSKSLSATFDEDQGELTMDAIEAIYSDGSPERLGAVINRSITRSDGSSTDMEGQFFPHVAFRMPHSDDLLEYEFGLKYRSQKENRWKDYTVNYGADPTPAARRRQYFDNSPNRTVTIINNLTYRAFFARRWNLSVNYEYRFLDQIKDSYMYALDRLADMGVYGILPAGYLDTFDPANSYTSRLLENTHSLRPKIGYLNSLSDSWIMVNFGPTFALKHSRFDYTRAGTHSLLTPSYFLTKMTSGWDAQFSYNFDRQGSDRDTYYRHSIEYFFTLTPRTPDHIDMVDVVNDADPLNISLGNPGLKPEYRQKHSLEYIVRPARQLQNGTKIEYSSTWRALTRGYTYDTSTGVRHNRTYNVGGNSALILSDNFRWQFGSIKQFTLSNELGVDFSRYADMVGVDMAAPEPVHVRNRTLGEKLNFAWQIGKQSLQLRTDYTNRHTTSSQTGFRTIDANHLSCGVTGLFQLPAGIGISTDFTVYTRRGYEVRELDTTDPIWNMRLSWCPPRARQWVFMLDGFDMLHRLSNVNYAVTATGRTVSYTNALPRYLLFSVQYRLHIQPRKR